MWKGFGRKWLWPRKALSLHLPEEIEEITKERERERLE
jgi:hypothetical protein